jgi:hypothetical protein
MKPNTRFQIAYQTLRIALGLDIFMHGFARLGANFAPFAAGLLSQFKATILPEWLVTLTAYSIVPAERTDFENGIWSVKVE